MDIAPPEKKPFPRFVGVLFALLIPGIAHYLSGARKCGWILLGTVIILGVLGMCLAGVPNLIYMGLALLFLILPLFILGILVTSYRPVPRLSGKGWAKLVGCIVLFNLFKVVLLEAVPVTPYKIPSAAMEPTLRGIHSTAGIEPISVWDQLLKGQSYEEYRAKEAGPVSNFSIQNNFLTFFIGDTPHQLPAHLARQLKPRKNYKVDEVIWSGTIQKGDHLLANKYSYLFSRPRRGDIITFSTEGIDYQAVRDTIYLKRIVGLPGETISIRNGRLIVNGEPITEPAIFQTLEYGNDGLLSDADKSITLGVDEYLTLGDNTARHMSLDGRFYGAIERNSIIARVRTVYWPFNRIRAVE